MEVIKLSCLFLAFFLGSVKSQEVVKTGRKEVFVDLTHELHEDIPKHPIYQGLTRKVQTLSIEEKIKVKVEDICLPTHYGTHLDAPCHINGSWCLGDIPLERLIHLPTAVVDVRNKVFVNESYVDSDYRVTVDDLKQWESLHGQLPDEGVVLFLTGWGRFWNDTVKYLGSKGGGDIGNTLGVSHNPGLSEEAATWLIENRPAIYGFGIDTVNMDYGLSKYLEAHSILTGTNRYIIENLINLEKLPATGSRLTVGVLKLGRDASGSPARVIGSYQSSKF